MECLSCNATINETDNFCKNCGVPLKESVDKSKLTSEQIGRMLQLSFVYEIENLIDKAIDNYNIILSQVTEGYPDVYFKLACAYEAKGKMGKAIAQCQRAIKINPNYIEAHRKLAELYSDEGLYKEAIEEFKNVLAVEIKYTYADVHNNLGVAYEKSEDYKHAEESYKKAIAINPKYGKSHFNLGNLYSGVKKYDKAIEEYKKAIESNFKNLICLNNLALALIENDEKEEAENLLKSLVQDNPEYIFARKNLISLYLQMEKNDEAKKEAEEILKIDPNDAEIQQIIDTISNK